MHARFRVIETTTLDDGSKRYRVVEQRSARTKSSSTWR